MSVPKINGRNIEYIVLDEVAKFANPPKLTLEEAEILWIFVELAVDDGMAACLNADIGGREVSGADLADLVIEFSEAALDLTLWGDLDHHSPDEPLADWELTLLAEAESGEWDDGLGPIIVGNLDGWAPTGLKNEVP